MKAKKLVSALLAAVTAGTMLLTGSVTAGAASAKMKLRTVSFGEIEGTNVFWSMGDGYYALNHSADPNVDPDIDQIIYVGEDELESWQKTGKFAYKTVKTDFKTTDMLKIGGFTADGGYMQLQACGADRSALKRYIVTHNEKNTEITTAYTKGSDWCYTNPDGYTVGYNWNKSKQSLTVTVTAPDGTKKSKKLTYKGGGDGDFLFIASAGTGKYAAYLLWKSAEYSQEVYGVKKNGKLDTLFDSKPDFRLTWLGSGENYCAWIMYPVMIDDLLFDVFYDFYFSDSGEKIELCAPSSGKGFSLPFLPTGFCGKAYEKRVIAEKESAGSSSKYILIDVGAETILSDVYQSMSTADGEIYCVKNDKGQWGYINKKGKELAWFDYAGDFIGDYAPVVKNRKAYLIDRNMKQVSEKIDADWVGTYDDGLYYVRKGDKNILMTYKK